MTIYMPDQKEQSDERALLLPSTEIGQATSSSYQQSGVPSPIPLSPVSTHTPTSPAPTRFQQSRVLYYTAPVSVFQPPPLPIQKTPKKERAYGSQTIRWIMAAFVVYLFIKYLSSRSSITEDIVSSSLSLRFSVCMVMTIDYFSL